MSKIPHTRKPEEADRLRTQAEHRFAGAAQPETSTQADGELLHELPVHRIELEMQNESLHEMQLALEISRERYANLYEFAPVGFITLTAGGLISEINLTGAALLGKERGKLIGSCFAAIVPIADRNRWHQTFTKLLKNGVLRNYELTLQRSDGWVIHAQLDGLYPEDHNDMAKLSFAITDASERFHARVSEERLHHILDNTLDMIFIFSPDTLRFEYMNNGALKSIGCCRKDIESMTPADILPMVSEAECRAFMAPLINGRKETLRFETTLTGKGDKEIPVEARLQLVKERGGGKVLVAVVRDLSKRKRAEKSLRQQKKLLRQVIDTNPNPIFVKDQDGNFLLVNRAIAEHYGLAMKNMIGRNNRNINPNAEEVRKFMAADRDVIENQHEVIQTELLMSNGMKRWFRTVKRPLPQDDGSVHVLGIAVDITSLKEAQAKLAESYSELQRLTLHMENARTEERVRIARDLHDELGATLAALNMRIAWLASHLPNGMPQLSAETAEMAKLVADGIKTMRQVVSALRPNLLADAGLPEALKDYVSRFQRDTEIECVLDVPETTSFLDANQTATIFRIIQECLNNVAKHAQARKVTIRLVPQDESLLLEVQDDGIGFDPTEKPDTFGLLGIKERALMIGAETEIDSALGRGTRLSIGIPHPHGLD